MSLENCPSVHTTFRHCSFEALLFILHFTGDFLEYLSSPPFSEWSPLSYTTDGDFAGFYSTQLLAGFF